MYFCNLFGFALCLIVLMASKCAANWRNRQGQGENGQYSFTTGKISSNRAECRDSVATAYCAAVKRRNICNVPHYQKRCKMTCGKCPTAVVEKADCRDVGTSGFCNSILDVCKKHTYRITHLSKYCRKTCGLCSSQPAVKSQETICKDRPICTRLASIYKIKINNCDALTNPKIRKRAVRKCPQYCGVCAPKKNQQEVARKVRPVVEIVEAPKVIRTSSTSKNRAAHPPIRSSETDKKPRSGVFYIYTKYLSL